MYLFKYPSYISFDIRSPIREHSLIPTQSFTVVVRAFEDLVLPSFDKGIYKVFYSITRNHSEIANK